MSAPMQTRSRAFRWNHNLKVSNFPACAAEALIHLETLVAIRNKQNLATEIIAEYIFLERIQTGRWRKSMSQLAKSPMTFAQEYQLTIVFIEFFSKPGPRRDAIFHALFGSQLTQRRARLLYKLISAGISGSVTPVLTAAGAWMQQVGCKSGLSLEVIQNVVAEFILHSRQATKRLNQLSMIVPHFAAAFMAAVTELYLNERRSTVLTPPPAALLEVIAEWMFENPTTISQAAQEALVLPDGVTPMAFVSPLSGLMRWAVLSPLVSRSETYSKLHLSILNTLQEQAASGESAVLPKQDLMQILKSLQNHCSRLSGSKVQPQNDDTYQRCMNRFAQAVQVAICSKGVTCLNQLLSALQSLPSNTLMDAVVATHKKP